MSSAFDYLTYLRDALVICRYRWGKTISVGDEASQGGRGVEALASARERASGQAGGEAAKRLVRCIESDGGRSENNRSLINGTLI